MLFLLGGIYNPPGHKEFMLAYIEAIHDFKRSREAAPVLIKYHSAFAAV
jgi:hypothetical protein